MDFNSLFADLKAKFAAFEASARKLENQNLGDILGSIGGKLKQVAEHPDLNAAAAIHNSEVDAAAVSGHEG
jgi:hypothetical protein